MAVISVTITESSDEIVSGIPRTVVIETNIESTIFYTFDGTDPTEYSDIYTSSLKLPTDSPTLVFKVYATNGTDSSAVIENTYQTIQSVRGNNVRAAHTSTDTQANENRVSSFPFGSGQYQPSGSYIGVAEGGYNTYDPELPSTPSAYDADGNPSAYTNETLLSIPSLVLPIISSETDAIGQTGPNIGSLPKNTIQAPVPPPLEANISDKLFDPRALVIFQDFTSAQNPDDPVYVNRMHFTLQDPEKVSDGNQFFTVGLDTPAPSGHFLRQHYNPRDNTITYYYYDSSVNRWIISKTSYTPAAGMYDYSGIVFGREQGAGFVFEWRTFAQRFLF